jgi:hypothetical protein
MSPPAQHYSPKGKGKERAIDDMMVDDVNMEEGSDQDAQGEDDPMVTGDATESTQASAVPPTPLLLSSSKRKGKKADDVDMEVEHSPMGEGSDQDAQGEDDPMVTGDATESTRASAVPPTSLLLSSSKRKEKKAQGSRPSTLQRILAGPLSPLSSDDELHEEPHELRKGGRQMRKRARNEGGVQGSVVKSAGHSKPMMREEPLNDYAPWSVRGLLVQRTESAKRLKGLVSLQIY